MKIFGAIAWLILCGSAAAHADLPAADCGTAGEVFQRYLDALGGAAAIAHAQSLLIEAKETEPHTFHPQSMAHQRFRFEWESQNRILVKRQYLLSTATVIYDGVAWSLYNGRVSHNEDATPELRRKLMALPYNDSPEFQEFRMVADPMLLTRARELYRALEVAPVSYTHLGRPYTPFLNDASLAQNRPIYDLLQVNALRGPFYSRLDFETDRSFYIGDRKLVLYGGLDNAFNRTNFLGYYWMPRIGAYWQCGGNVENCISEQHEMVRFPDFGVRYIF